MRIMNGWTRGGCISSASSQVSSAPRTSSVLGEANLGEVSSKKSVGSFRGPSDGATQASHSKFCSHYRAKTGDRL